MKLHTRGSPCTVLAVWIAASISSRTAAESCREVREQSAALQSHRYTVGCGRSRSVQTRSLRTRNFCTDGLYFQRRFKEFACGHGLWAGPTSTVHFLTQKRDTLWTLCKDFALFSFPKRPCTWIPLWYLDAGLIPSWGSQQFLELGCQLEKLKFTDHPEIFLFMVGVCLVQFCKPL